MTRPRPRPGRQRRAVRIPGIVLVLVGAILVLLSFRFFDWYSVAPRADSTSEITFSALHNSADQLSGTGAATAYFDWLAWLLLIATIAAGLAANLPLPHIDALRVAGFLLGLVGVAMTYFAVAQLHSAQVSAGAANNSVFYNSTWGMWTAFLGFLICAAGAALGARPVRR